MTIIHYKVLLYVLFFYQLKHLHDYTVVSLDTHVTTGC